MNQRPTRVPSPDAQTTVADRIEDASFVEVERSNNLPARPSAQVKQAIPDRAVSAEPEPVLPTTGFAKLASAIAAVMAEIKPVEKEGWNDFQKYNYARMQDLSRELTPLMGKHGIVIFQTEEGREMFDDGKAVAVRYRFTIVHSSGEIWPERPVQTGLSSCRNSKGGFDDKTLNKCHTSARKYFLLSLFQIPTADEDDSDSGGDGEERRSTPRPQGRRPVPSPDGKVGPHLIPIGEGDTPESWTKRFGGFVEKATTTAEIDDWYNKNAGQFEKLKRFEAIYNAAIDHMDACAAKLAPKPDPISSGKPDGNFPGDKPMRAISSAASSDPLDIPWSLDAKLSESDRDWLMSLKEAWEQCSNVDEIAAEQESIMAPAKETVSPYAWRKACDLMDKHIERVQRG